MMHHSCWVDQVLSSTLMNPCLDTNPRYEYSCMVLVSIIVDIIIMIFILQNHPGRPPPQQVWVFGMCDTSHTPTLGVMRIVPDRSATTLLPNIRQHVRSGSTVRSDEWAAYNRVQRLPSVGQHRVVNHTLHFVDPAKWCSHPACGVILELGKDKV